LGRDSPHQQPTVEEALLVSRPFTPLRVLLSGHNRDCLRLRRGRRVGGSAVLSAVAVLALFCAGCRTPLPLEPRTLDPQVLAEAQLLAQQRTTVMEYVKEKARQEAERRKKELEMARKKQGKAVTLNPEDEFIVDVWLQDGITQLKGFPYKGTVRPDGTEFIPGVGKVVCSGRTAVDIQEEIKKRLSVTLNNPMVLLQVTKHVGARVTIVGEVLMHPNRDSGPGVYPIRGDTPLTDFIMAAGGYTKKADIRNVRVVYPDGRVEIVNLEAILAGDMRKNIILHGGETVYVPEQEKTGTVLVMGHVRAPGVYGLRGDPRLSRVIAQAGGILPEGSRKRIYLVRGDLYKPQVLTVNLDNVLRRGLKGEDVRLVNGDTVYVPLTHVAEFRQFLSIVGLPITLARQFVFLEEDVFGGDSR